MQLSPAQLTRHPIVALIQAVLVERDADGVLAAQVCRQHDVLVDEVDRIVHVVILQLLDDGAIQAAALLSEQLQHRAEEQCWLALDAQCRPILCKVLCQRRDARHVDRNCKGCR